MNPCGVELIAFCVFSLRSSMLSNISIINSPIPVDFLLNQNMYLFALSVCHACQSLQPFLNLKQLIGLHF